MENILQSSFIRYAVLKTQGKVEYDFTEQNSECHFKRRHKMTITILWESIYGYRSFIIFIFLTTLPYLKMMKSLNWIIIIYWCKMIENSSNKLISSASPFVHRYHLWGYTQYTLTFARQRLHWHSFARSLSEITRKGILQQRCSGDKRLNFRTAHFQLQY